MASIALRSGSLVRCVSRILTKLLSIAGSAISSPTCLGQRHTIFFNPPYVPTAVGQRLSLSERLQVDGDQVWNGGEDGTTVLRSFLQQASRYTSDRGRVVFGVQEIFVPQETVSKAIRECGYTMLSRITRSMIPSVVYVVTPIHNQEL